MGHSSGGELAALICTDDRYAQAEGSAVTHVAKNKGIPPFLILHIAGNPDTGAQAQRLAAVLQAAGIPVKVVAGRRQRMRASTTTSLQMIL